LIAALLFWVSTGIVYVESYQEAAVYRLGALQEETLDPGLHLTLPYPLEKADIYDTKTVNKMTIGYKSTENIDNVWTEAHGDSEYKLLLGSGNELVSINLRVEYRINDLKQYVQTATNPERIVEAKAYELITDRTINTDLETMLSTNRETFATTFHQQLEEEVEKRALGVEIVNVIMESIHPPVDVAQVYQDFIGAEIDAERLILDAQAQAAVKRAEGDSTSREMINMAKTNDAQQRALANSEISEFMAALTASNSYPDEYAYYKYLNAICSAYQKAKLVIVGDGVDSGRLYFGSWSGN
jgi:membrane protease subunit HflK